MTQDRRLRLNDEPARLAAVRRYDLVGERPERVLDEITGMLRRIFAAPMAAVSIVEADRIRRPSLQGFDAREAARDEALCDHVIRGAEGLAVGDARRGFADDPLVSGRSGVRSYLGMPLTTPDGFNVGAVGVFDVAPRVFTKADARLMRRFADLVISHFELRKVAGRDGSTGALSRRGFEEALHKEFARHQRQGSAAALAMFGLDDFAAVNDRLGHLAGDAVLRAVAAACGGVLRRTDCLGRVGGAEFAVLLAGASLADSLVSMERMRLAIAAGPAPGHRGPAVTARFGAAVCAGDVADVGAWFAAADANLVAAKRHGRNRRRITATAP